MKRILVTGGTGFVGGNLTRRLLAEGHRVHLLVRPQHKDWRIRSIRDSISIHFSDMMDHTQLETLLRKIRPEWVFHLAAYGAYSHQTDREQIFATNLNGTVNLMSACLRTGFEAFIHTGSSSEYGYKDHAPSETDFLEPNSYYAVSKASSTLYCSFVGRHQKAPVVTLRLYSVYGPYEEPTRLMPTLLRHALQKKLPPLVDPGVARDFVFIDDVCDAYLLSARQASNRCGAVYNVGSSIQTTMAELVELARRIFGVEEKPVWGSMPNRSWDTSVWVADSRKIQSELNWRAGTNLTEGLKKFSEWVQRNPEGSQCLSN